MRMRSRGLVNVLATMPAKAPQAMRRVTSDVREEKVVVVVVVVVCGVFVGAEEEDMVAW